jgi:hypothetical protein
VKTAIILLIKDENEALIEWYSYHKSLGFDYFFIFDNESVIPIKALGDDMDVIKWDGKHIGSQTDAYNTGMKLAKEKGIDSCLVIDTDEFLILDRNLQDFLKDFENKSAIGLNWLIYGSSFLEDKPANVLENFIYSSEENNPINRHIKSFIKVSRFNHFIDPHFASVKAVTVNINGEPIFSALSDTILHRCRINHYFVKSRSEFIEKCNRGRGDKAGSRSLEEFDGYLVDFNKVKREPIKF